VKVERKQSENSVDAVPRMGIHQQQQQQPQQQQRKQQRKQLEWPQQQQQQPLLCKNAGVHHQDGDWQSVTHVGGRVGPLQRATDVIILPSDAQRTNPGLKQRLLSDFLPATLRPQDVRPLRAVVCMCSIAANRLLLTCLRRWAAILTSPLRVCHC
jgi:hypothetical protein